MPKILHIAPQNFAGMPFDFVKMHRQAGFNANLVTIYKNSIDFEEDISLGFDLPEGKISQKWRNRKVINKGNNLNELKYYKPGNFVEEVFFKFRDLKNSKRINRFIDNHNLFNYDIFHFDGGMDFYRDCRFAKRLKKLGKKIVTCYFGSDLRTRGVFKELDDISDLILSVEYDHIEIHNRINYIYFPFDIHSYKPKEHFNQIPKIIHSPTNRLYKGTDKIIKVIEELKSEFEFEFLLIEGMPRAELLKIKAECDIAIDQVGGELGGTGYGKNSIENLALGIPTITEFTPDYASFIKDSPFINVNINNLKIRIAELLSSIDIRKEYSDKGKLWVQKYHSFDSVNSLLMKLYKIHKII